jgi:mRNA-degrading endonuclease RelE of RelBE toxin-antitoxin system
VKARAFLDKLPDKIQRATREQLLTLRENPFPGDSEFITLPGGYSVYRLHIGRILTVFYQVNTKEQTVQILKIMTIEQAHKEYRRWG